MSHDSGEEFESTSEVGKDQESFLRCRWETGQIIAATKWKGTSIAKGLQENFAIKFCDSKLIDFCPSPSVVVVFVSIKDYTKGAKAYESKINDVSSALYGKIKNIVIACQRFVSKSSEDNQDFLEVQKLAVIQHGLSLIPLTEEKCLVQLLQQFASVVKRPNPFKYGLKGSKNSLIARPSKENTVITSLLTVPGLGEKTAQSLLNEFKSLSAIAQASESDLTRFVGSHFARVIHRHFNNTS